MNGYDDLETCIDLCLYIFPLFIFIFAKKSSPNVNLQIKRDTELQKPVAHTSIWLGKRESDQKLKWKVYSKSQRLSLQGEISIITLTMRGDFSRKDQKDQMLWLKVESNVKFQDMLSSFVGGHIYIFI